MKKTAALFVFLLMYFLRSYATTWDEPWMDKVITDADHFVFAKIISADEKSVQVQIIKTLGGNPLQGEITISNYYLLSLCSTSGGHGPEFHLKGVDSCYFLLKKNIKGEFAIATPTTGFATVQNGKVAATFRHSYHKAIIDPELYESSMSALFNHYHNKEVDYKFVNDLVNTCLIKKPAGFDKDELETFFKQHTALELIYHLKLQGHFKKIEPFLKSSNFHHQVSAARALGAYNTPDSKTLLLALVNENKVEPFVQVMAIWSLAELKPKDLKSKIVELEKTASNEENGFGGNIMDPRVCTKLPSVKGALRMLLKNI